MEPYVSRAVLNGIDLRNHDFWNILMRRKKIGNQKMFLIENFDIFGSRVWYFLEYLDTVTWGNTRLGYRRYQNFRSKTFFRFPIFFYALICSRSRDSAGLFHSERWSLLAAPFFVQKLPVILFFLEMDSYIHMFFVVYPDLWSVFRIVCMSHTLSVDTKLTAGESKRRMVPVRSDGSRSVSLAWGTRASKLKPATGCESRDLGSQLWHD